MWITSGTRSVSGSTLRRLRRWPGRTGGMSRAPSRRRFSTAKCWRCSTGVFLPTGPSARPPGRRSTTARSTRCAWTPRPRRSTIPISSTSPISSWTVRPTSTSRSTPAGRFSRCSPRRRSNTPRASPSRSRGATTGPRRWPTLRPKAAASSTARWARRGWSARCSNCRSGFRWARSA